MSGELPQQGKNPGRQDFDLVQVPGALVGGTEHELCAARLPVPVQLLRDLLRRPGREQVAGGEPSGAARPR